MKHLISILIFFGFVSAASAEEINFLCKGNKNYQLNINIEEEKVLLDRVLFIIKLIKDDTITAKIAHTSLAEYIEINRLTGEMWNFEIGEDGKLISNYKYQCEYLEKL